MGKEDQEPFRKSSVMTARVPWAYCMAVPNLEKVGSDLFGRSGDKKEIFEGSITNNFQETTLDALLPLLVVHLEPLETRIEVPEAQHCSSRGPLCLRRVIPEAS